MRFVDADGVVVERGGAARGPFDGLVLVEEYEPGESLTQQSELPNTDLNVMVKRWMAGQPMPQFAPLQYGDVSEIRDIQDIHQRIAAMKSEFMKLPAELRLDFNNDPLEFAEYLADPANLEEARQLGLFGSGEAEAPPAKQAAPSAPAGPDKGAEPPRQS